MEVGGLPLEVSELEEAVEVVGMAVVVGTLDRGGGGGGSGYVFTSDTAAHYPSGCKLTSDFYLTNAQTIAGDQPFPAPNGGNETGHGGVGYARITLVE